MFSITDFSLGKYKGLSIYNDYVKLNLLFKGLTIIDLFTTINNNHINMLDGYKSEQEFESYSGARSCLMAPYSNQIKNFTYEFNNQTFSFENSNYTKEFKYHGLIKFKEFELIDYDLSNSQANMLFTTSIHKNEFSIYPFDVKIDIKLTLTNNSLKINIKGSNNNTFDIPFGCGWHPYFKLQSKLEDLYLQVPSKTIVLLDDTYCPIENYKKKLDIKDSLYYYTLKQINDSKINVCFVDLEASEDNLIHTYLVDKIHNIKLDVFQQKGVLYVFTGDGLKYRERESIAIEPVEFITNVYNHKEFHNDLIIKPNSNKNFDFGVRWSSYE